MCYMDKSHAVLNMNHLYFIHVKGSFQMWSKCGLFFFFLLYANCYTLGPRYLIYSLTSVLESDHSIRKERPVTDLQSNLLTCCHDSCTVSLRDPETVPSCVFTGRGSQTDTRAPSQR